MQNNNVTPHGRSVVTASRRYGRKLLLTTALGGLTLGHPAMAQDSTLISIFHENFSFANSTSVSIFGEPGTTGTIENLDGLSVDFEIDADGAARVEFDPQDVTVLTDGQIQRNALFINANNPISALATNQLQFTSDMTSLLDTGALGREYVVLAYQQLGASLPSQLSITAIEDGTEVTFTSPEDLSGFAAGETHTVTLDAGESLGLSGFDATGTVIEASANVAVFGGGQCVNTPPGVFACDHVIAQNFSADNFATDFRMVQTPLAGADADLVRLVTATDDTEIFIDGVSQGSINRGEFLEIDNVGNAHITASNPVQLGQYMRGEGGSRTLGDPAMAVIPATDQWLDSYVFTIPSSDGEASFEQNYLLVVIGEGAANTLVLNDETVEEGDYFEREVLDGFVHGALEIGPGVGSISADEDFLAMIAGFDSFDSYLTVVATAFAAGASPPRPTVLPSEPEFEAAPRIIGNMVHTRGLRDRRGSRINASPMDTVVSSKGHAGVTAAEAEAARSGNFWLNLPVVREQPRSGDFVLVDSMRQTRFGLQAGYDFPSIETDNGEVVFGTFIEYQRSDTRIHSVFGANSISTNALGIGATATWFGHGGTYVDVVGRAMRFRNSFDNAERQNAHSVSLSLELGQEVEMRNGWTVTPQAQLSFASISMDSVDGFLGETSEFRNTDSLRGRVGVAFERDWTGGNGENHRLFLIANLIGESFNPLVDVTVNNQTNTYEGRSERNMFEFGTGGTFGVGNNSHVSAAVYAGRDLGSGGRTNLRGELGVSVRW